MATQQEELLLRIRSDVEQARAGIDQIVSGLGRIHQQTATTTSTLSSLNQTVDSMGRGFSRLQAG